jgi:hydrogenase expression/formation protein HypD
MKYIDDFRDSRLARKVSGSIAAEAEPGRRYSLMEFCGGHTHAVSRYGIEDLLPETIRLVHGPGCPVCVLPVGRIDNAIALARHPGVVLCSYGDMLRVPGSNRLSLFKARADGADVRMIYSALDALDIARQNPDRTVVFFAIGFETTTPATAVAIQAAQRNDLRNFRVFCNHVLTPAAIQSILDSPEVSDPAAVPIDGFIGPAHVSVVIGSRPYEFFAENYHKPVVIAGFEPLDVIQAILMLVRQINDGRHAVENQYTRAVSRDGNAKAQRIMAEVFELKSSFEWRGLGEVPHSALRIRPAYAAFDAERQFELPKLSAPDAKSCECAAIVRGLKHPRDCKLFGNGCTPDHPIGSCMVSSEGACAAYYSYGRFRDARASASGVSAITVPA